MTTFTPRQVNEHGPGRCSKCLAVVTKLIVKDRLLMGEWNGKAWSEHVCKGRK